MSEKKKQQYLKGFKKSKSKLKIFTTLESFPLEQISSLVVSDPLLVPSQHIPWNLVAGKLLTRSYDDCRNIWNQTLYPILSDPFTSASKEDQIALIEGIISQDPEEEDDIQFDDNLQKS